jgi:hypothetical protein
MMDKKATNVSGVVTYLSASNMGNDLVTNKIKIKIDKCKHQ